jgi:hypothetical protein
MAGVSDLRMGDNRYCAVWRVVVVARYTAAAIVEAILPGVADAAALDAAVSNRLKG